MSNETPGATSPFGRVARLAIQSDASRHEGVAARMCRCGTPAYSSVSFKGPSAAVAERLLAHPPTAQLGLLPHVLLLLGGGLPIKIGDEVVGGIGVSGAPGGEKDEACAKVALDKK